MMKRTSIGQPTTNATLNLALDTLSSGKQALIFVNTKASAEKEAEDISKKSNLKKPELSNISEDILSALPRPTKQCERLARCVRTGIAFHHAGLASKQKELIENGFRTGLIQIICATPTLAAGLDLPAYRAIIKDLKRYGGAFGMTDIPVLEYLQMAGRAGRPRFDTQGEAICIAKSEDEKSSLHFKYVLGEPEAIYSKLAVEPVLRTYLLSLIATGFVSSQESIMDFFSRTFWAHQFQDMSELHQIISKTLRLLEEWTFITSTSGQVTTGFVNGNELLNEAYTPTPLGRRVSELYLDPLTAHRYSLGLSKAPQVSLNEISFLHLISGSLEMRPWLSVRTKEYDIIQEKSALVQPHLLINEPSLYDPDYEEFLESLKCTIMFCEWTDEKDEQYILETYNVRPGELRAKLDIADWLLFSVSEIARITAPLAILKDINKTRVRLRYGAKEELLPLLKLEGIGRVRARRIYSAGIKDAGSLKSADITTLSAILGPVIARSVQEQLDTNISLVPKGTRKGQLSLRKF